MSCGQYCKNSNDVITILALLFVFVTTRAIMERMITGFWPQQISAMSSLTVGGKVQTPLLKIKTLSNSHFDVIPRALIRINTLASDIFIGTWTDAICYEGTAPPKRIISHWIEWSLFISRENIYCPNPYHEIITIIGEKNYRSVMANPEIELILLMQEIKRNDLLVLACH